MQNSQFLAKRKQSLQLFNKMAKTEIKFDPETLSEHLAGGDLTNRGNVYMELGNFAQKSFFDSLDASQQQKYSGSIISGFTVLTRLIGIAPNSYIDYCSEREKTPSLDELSTSLKASQETPARLMSMPNNINRDVEYGLGLRSMSSIDYGSPFHFEETYRGPIFIPNDGYYSRIYHQALRENVPDTSLPTHWQRCPARRLVLKNIWPAMIDLASETPEVFAYDVGLMDN